MDSLDGNSFSLLIHEEKTKGIIYTVKEVWKSDLLKLSLNLMKFCFEFLQELF